MLFALAQSLLGSRAFFEALWQRRARLADVDLHLVWGTRTRRFHRTMLARWQQAFPRARTTTIADAGHWPHEEAPQAVIDAMRATLTYATRVL